MIVTGLNYSDRILWPSSSLLSTKEKIGKTTKKDKKNAKTIPNPYQLDVIRSVSFEQIQGRLSVMT